MERAVLIVDDSRILCKELAKELRCNFFSTYIAYTVLDALEILNKKKIDIILLDVKIPDENGLKFLKQVKEKWTNCEVIIITGYGSQEIAIEALRGGAIDYLEKPLKSDELDAALGRALEKLAEKEELIYCNSVLIVDDDKKFTQKIKKILEKEGYNSFTAHNGKEGLEIVKNTKIDVILADIKMPVMDGIELLEKAKKLHQDIEVIMITGYGNKENAVKSLRKGAINYIYKPINIEELCIALKKAIERVDLNRNQLYRSRELKINTEIISKMNEKMEKKIEERTQELSQTQTQLFQTSKLATLGEMCAGLAHEINQPLTGISLIAMNIKKLIERRLLTEKEIKEAIQEISDNVKRMSNIVTHIRAFARQDIHNFIQVNVNECIKKALNLLGEQLRLHDIKIIKELDYNLPMIEGEPYQIEQVIINIISNARDALDDKEKWDKEMLKDWSKTMTIKTAMEKHCEKGDCICIYVSDIGTGMLPEVKQKMFEPFFTKKEVGKATGLGMSISYGIVQSHKGRIYVDTKEGEGTTISVKFPIKMKEQ